MFIESAPVFLQGDKTFFVDRNDRKRKKKISNHNERTTIRFSEAGFFWGGFKSSKVLLQPASSINLQQINGVSLKISAEIARTPLETFAGRKWWRRRGGGEERIDHQAQHLEPPPTTSARRSWCSRNTSAAFHQSQSRPCKGNANT